MSNISISNHLINIINNIKYDINLQISLYLTDEEENTECPSDILYKTSKQREYALFTYIGEKVFNNYKYYAPNYLNKIDSDVFVEISDEIQKVLDSIDKKEEKLKNLNINNFSNYNSFLKESKKLNKDQNNLFNYLGTLIFKQVLQYNYSFYNNYINA